MPRGLPAAFAPASIVNFAEAPNGTQARNLQGSGRGSRGAHSRGRRALCVARRGRCIACASGGTGRRPLRGTPPAPRPSASWRRGDVERLLRTGTVGSAAAPGTAGTDAVVRCRRCGMRHDAGDGLCLLRTANLREGLQGGGSRQAAERLRGRRTCACPYRSSCTAACVRPRFRAFTAQNSATWDVILAPRNPGVPIAPRHSGCCAQHCGSVPRTPCGDSWLSQRSRVVQRRGYVDRARGESGTPLRSVGAREVRVAVQDAGGIFSGFGFGVRLLSSHLWGVRRRHGLRVTLRRLPVRRRPPCTTTVVAATAPSGGSGCPAEVRWMGVLLQGEFEC